MYDPSNLTTWRNKREWEWTSIDREEYDAWTKTRASNAELVRAMEDDRVVSVHPDGSISHPEGLHAPDVYHVPNAQHPKDVDVLDAEWSTWSVGMTGQFGYKGAVMHSSELLAGPMAERILRNPGTYVTRVVEVLPDDEWYPLTGEEESAWRNGHTSYENVRETDAGVEVRDEDPTPAGWVVLQHVRSGYACYLTGDLVEPDGTDENCYGEPCEPGHGYELHSGWVDLEWSTWQVHEDRDNVRPLVYEPDEYDDVDFNHVRWLAKQLGEQLTGTPHYDGGGTVYSDGAYEHPYDGRSITLTAHPVGFTDDEIASAIDHLTTKGA
jgi:hypothetical protein